MAGQAPALIQELVKDWEDSKGIKHFGIYDENNEDCVRWAESYPHAVPGCLKVVEPRKWRNLMFEAAKALVPMGKVKFISTCPKNNVMVMDDETSHKLSKKEYSSIIQMDLMKEEIASMVRIKSPKGGVTYQLPVEKRGKMHDDRAYAFVMAC